MQFKIRHFTEIVSIYKIIVSLIRIYIGTLIILFNYNLHQVLHYVFHINMRIEKETLFYYISSHLKETSIYLIIILAITLIVISFLEIIFSVMLMQRNKSGAVGLLMTCIAWVPIEIMFVSKFLIMQKALTLAIDFIIIIFLIRLIKEKPLIT